MFSNTIQRSCGSIQPNLSVGWNMRLRISSSLYNQIGPLRRSLPIQRASHSHGRASLPCCSSVCFSSHPRCEPRSRLAPAQGRLRAVSPSVGKRTISECGLNSRHGGGLQRNHPVAVMTFSLSLLFPLLHLLLQQPYPSFHAHLLCG